MDNRGFLKVDDYRFYYRNGYLLLRGLLSADEVKRLTEWTEDLLYGRVEVAGLPKASESATREEMFGRLSRIHTLHRVDPTAEWGALRPVVLDTLEALIGPDILSLESMLFYNPPGKGGQGWHQDSLYVSSSPDTVTGVWMALDDVDEENGCLWVMPGSHSEPVHPAGSELHHVSARRFADLHDFTGHSDKDDEVNQLAKHVSPRYEEKIPVRMKPGDVLFFHSHLLHRSYPNTSKDRLRRAFVCHYCHARSYVNFKSNYDYEGSMGNHLHVLARGSTPYPYARPVFGTAVEIDERRSEAEREEWKKVGGVVSEAAVLNRDL